MITVFVACLTACASTEEYDPPPPPTDAEIAKILGCGPEEVAMCIEVNCEFEDWYCASRNDVRDMFKVGDSEH